MSSDKSYNIATSPLYYVRSGGVSIYHGRLWNAGVNGYAWSSTAAAALSSSTSATAYYLSFNASGVNPSAGPANRWYGFPLRCLVR